LNLDGEKITLRELLERRKGKNQPRDAIVTVKDISYAVQTQEIGGKRSFIVNIVVHFITFLSINAENMIDYSKGRYT
jgi:hypothetical protein